jgi:hypothetical protein
MARGMSRKGKGLRAETTTLPGDELSYARPARPGETEKTALRAPSLGPKERRLVPASVTNKGLPRPRSGGTPWSGGKAKG